MTEDDLREFVIEDSEDLLAQLRNAQTQLDSEETDATSARTSHGDPLKFDILRELKKKKLKKGKEKDGPKYSKKKRDLKHSKKAELKRQRGRDHLKRELDYGAKNREYIDKKWFELLQKYRMSEIQTDMRVLINRTEQILDLKDKQINLLLDELEEANEQEITNFKLHCTNFENIIDIFYTRLDDLKLYFEEELESLNKMKEEELNAINEKADEEENFLKMIMYGLEVENKKIDQQIAGEYLALIAEEKNKNVTNLQQMTNNLETKFYNFWSSYKKTLSDFEEETKETREKYEMLLKQERFIKEISREQEKQLSKLQSTRVRLQNEEVVLKEEIHIKLRLRQEEQSFFQKCFGIMKGTFAEDYGNDVKKLQILTFESNNILNHVENTRKKAEKILTFNSICRKFETRAEKILPFPDSLIPEITTEFMKYYTDYRTSSKDRKEMDSFWQKVGQANALQHILKEENRAMEIANEKLKYWIKIQCFGKYSCAAMVDKKSGTCKKLTFLPENTKRLANAVTRS